MAVSGKRLFDFGDRGRTCVVAFQKAVIFIVTAMTTL